MGTEFTTIDALELAKLRIKDDGISWAEAYTEYRHLVRMGVAGTMHIGKHLQEYQAMLNKLKEGAE